MKTKLVKDLMIPADLYPTIDEDATMLEAVVALRKAQENVPPGQQPFRAVLVVNKQKKIVGKIGHLSFLKALEPKYNQVFDIDKLTRANMSSMYLETMLGHYNLWDDSADNICQIAKSSLARDIMQPVIENIDENEPLLKAIHRIIMWQSLSVLVTRGNEIVGILRLSDVYDEVENFITSSCQKK